MNVKLLACWGISVHSGIDYDIIQFHLYGMNMYMLMKKTPVQCLLCYSSIIFFYFLMLFCKVYPGIVTVAFAFYAFDSRHIIESSISLYSIGPI